MKYVQKVINSGKQNSCKNLLISIIRPTFGLVIIGGNALYMKSQIKIRQLSKTIFLMFHSHSLMVDAREN